MKILLLSCSTGEGHNHCALAVKEALDARGHETSFLDMLHMFGDPGPLSFDKILNRISTKAPDVFGMPVAARFLAPMDKAAARAALGLPADKKIYLIMTGGIGCGDAVSLCDAIRRVPDENALLCVLPGRNEALRQALEDAYHGQGVLTVPFTDQVPAYMHAADVLLSKAGGISSSEAAMLGVPLVHTMAIPGVETENAAFFARHGLSFFARNVDEAARFADRLIYDPACAERMLTAQSACLPRDGAEQIAAAITA